MVQGSSQGGPRVEGSTEMAEGSVETPVMDAPPASYLLNLVAAEAAGVDGEAVRDVVAAIAPIVGTARTASAIGNVADALGFAELVVELQDVDEEDMS